MGNQLYRIAAVYAIGRYPNINRAPGLNLHKRCLKSYIKEFSETFPNVVKAVKFEDLSKKAATSNNLLYQNPELVPYIPNEYVRITANDPRRLSYITNIMDEIRQLFAFHPKLKAEVEEYGTKLFKSDTSHKMCVHIRRGDFIKHRLLETRKEFLIPAMETVRNFVSEKYSTDHVSLVFFTDDEKFVDSLDFTNDDYVEIYRPKLRSRGAVMCFAVTYCDSLLVSASGSTFASWIGLLMPQEKDFFYNQRHLKGNGNTSVTWLRTKKFPPYWNGLELDENNKTVIIVT